RPHVAEQMNPAAVQKHRAEEGEDLFRRGKELGHVRPRVAGGNDGKGQQHLLQVGAELQLAHENEAVEDNDAERGRGKTGGGNVIAEGKHITKPIEGFGNLSGPYRSRTAKSASTVIRWWAAMLLRMPLSVPVLIER